MSIYICIYKHIYRYIYIDEKLATEKFSNSFVNMNAV